MTGRHQKRIKIEEIKSRTNFLACEKLGHWFRDRSECRKEMERRSAKKKDVSSTAGEIIPTKEGDDSSPTQNNSKSLFR